MEVLSTHCLFPVSVDFSCISDVSVLSSRRSPVLTGSLNGAYAQRHS